jgi:threonine dehydratase
MESFQVTGSFKARGALYALQALPDDGQRTVVAASAGNHGAGIAHAAGVLGWRAVVVVPEATPQRKLRAVERRHVTVERVTGGYDHAERHARSLALARRWPFLSPYDDDFVAAGNGGSLGFEIVQTLGRVPDRVVVPIGGGGLGTGLAWALAREAGEGPGVRRRVWGAQSEVSPAFALSLEQACAVERLDPEGSTLAEGLEGGISARAFARAAAVLAGVFVVTEAEIAHCMRQLWCELGVRVEGSGAAALVPALLGRMAGEVEGDLVMVLTGRNVDDGVFRRVVEGAGP